MLPDRYRFILCDIWGVLHDGEQAFPGAQAALARWQAEGRTVILVTNAPRPSRAVAQRLAELGIGPALYSRIVSSGDVGIDWALAHQSGAGFGFIGSMADRAALVESGVTLVDAPTRQFICTGFAAETGFALESYQPALAAFRAQDATMLCFNPDRLVMRGDTTEPCAGALADVYTALGGNVVQFGKPHPAIYDRCLTLCAALAGQPVEAGSIVAIGDAFLTDVSGAARCGIDILYVTDGVDNAARGDADPIAYLQASAATAGLTLPQGLTTVARLA
jgi:HAD superfamily hydrolase (TIGR01459 family)